jgi:CRISPR-associated protein Cas2
MNTLFYLIIYDFPATKTGNKRRQRTYEMLCGYGKWTQYSVFECFLTAVQFAKLVQKLEKLIKVSEDSVRIYVLDAGSVRRTIAYGGEKPKQVDTLII